MNITISEEHALDKLDKLVQLIKEQIKKSKQNDDFWRSHLMVAQAHIKEAEDIIDILEGHKGLDRGIETV